MPFFQTLNHQQQQHCLWYFLNKSFICQTLLRKTELGVGKEMGNTETESTMRNAGQRSLLLLLNTKHLPRPPSCGPHCALLAVVFSLRTCTILATHCHMGLLHVLLPQRTKYVVFLITTHLPSKFLIIFQEWAPGHWKQG